MLNMEQILTILMIFGAPDQINSVFFRCPDVCCFEEYISRNALSTPNYDLAVSL